MDAVLKVGGSLSRHLYALENLGREVRQLVNENDIIIIPGGGEFADTVRRHYNIFNLSQETAHKMAIKAMEQYGMMLSDLIPDSRIVEYIYEAYEALSDKKVPILLPYSLVKDAIELEASWDVTSDSISLYLAYLIGSKKLILVKDVDGIYIDRDKLLESVTIDWLRTHSSCLDKYFPELLSKMYVDTYIVNGLYPERIRNILYNKPSVYTMIVK